MSQHEKINCLELPSQGLSTSKQVFQQVFGNHGSEYTAFADNAGLAGGFYLSEHVAQTAKASVLVVFYRDDLSATQHKIEQAGVHINQATFSFPGGHRFHFLNPCDNEYAVWSAGLFFTAKHGLEPKRPSGLQPTSPAPDNCF